MTYPKAHPYRIEHERPIAYRLAKLDGELVLQGSFKWEDIGVGGWPVAIGEEWRTIPIVNLDYIPGAPG